MVIVWGTRMAGKVDLVPNIGYVSTRFFHLYYVPLIPLESFLVFSEDGDNVNGVRIGADFKSILVGWLRGFGWTMGIFGPIATAICVADGLPQYAAGWGGISVAAIAALLVTYLWKGVTQASYERARRLGQRVGLSPEALLMLEVAYGRMTADEADRELERLMEHERPVEQATW